MEGVNIKFKRLPEELLIDESGRTQPWQRRVKNLFETVPWRAVTVVLSLSFLVTIICLNRRDISYKYVTIMERINQSDGLNEQYKVDLQKVSRKLNIAWRNLSVIGRVLTFS